MVDAQHELIIKTKKRDDCCHGELFISRKESPATTLLKNGKKEKKKKMKLVRIVYSCYNINYKTNQVIKCMFYRVQCNRECIKNICCSLL